MPMTILKPQATIRPAEQEDRQELANLIHFEIHVHRHLDWRTPLDWIGYPPYFVMEQRKSVIAALACPPDPPMVAWIRLFAVAQDLSVERTWEALWPDALGQLGSMLEVKWVAALALWPWFAKLLEAQGFEENNRVVMLNWEAGNKLPETHTSDVIVRPMNFDDIGGVHEVDTASFAPVWQNSRPSLELAYRQAAVATVAEYEERMVGYQISTATPIGGHLARLAVVPDCQGHGIGAALVGDLLMQFKRRGAKKVTVNTQKDNPGSLNLYQKNGFYLTGEEYPVYSLNLK
jgi:[ribosomal protein S18]-alanine N-acetyltransferase